MSKLLQIEQALSRLGASKFQKLCAAYLKYKYPNDDVKETGGSHGQDTTTRGTPDVRIDLQNGNYIFAECTIKKAGRLKKFKEDIEEGCFNETKSHIKIEKIELIYLCHNTKSLKENEKEELRKICAKKNCKLKFIDIDDLKFDLFKVTKYKILAKDFLNINIGTLQILPITDFIEASQKRATSLTNIFFDRESELEVITNDLENEDIVLISGQAGVGKTRFALQTLQKYQKENNEYELIGIHNKGQDLFEDLQINFQPEKKYLLLVDDANRLNNFLYIIDLINEYEIKIIITVRDYALGKVKKQLSLENYEYSEIKLEKLDDETIRKILLSIKITHPKCIDNITRIADGNPRLVLMSSDYVLKEKDCSKLRNVESIYDKFFERQIDDLSELNDNTILKILGIICFFRVVRKDNKSENDKMYTSFDVKEEVFWDSTLKLHELELVDLHEDQSIVKISDQVLANYFFYHTFIKKEIISYSIILECFLDGYSGKIKDNLIPILNYFGYHEVFQKIEKNIDSKHNSIKDNEKALIQFYEIFWFCKKTELLSWINDKVDKQKKEEQTDGVDWFSVKKDEYYYEIPPYLELLKLFSNHPDENFKLSLKLIFKCAIKNQKLIPDVIQYCKNELSIERNSYEMNYFFQTTLFDFLFEKIEQEENKLFYTKTLFEISGYFLKYYYDAYGGGRKKNTISIVKVNLIDTPVIKRLRSDIWDFLYSNFDKNQESVFGIFKNYIENTHSSIFRHEERRNPSSTTSVLRKFDDSFVVSFFENKLSENSFKNSVLYFSYIEELSDASIEKYDFLTKKFKTSNYNTFLVLNWNYYKGIRDYKRTYQDEFYDIKKKELTDFVKNYTLVEYIDLLNTTKKIINSFDEGRMHNLGSFRKTSIEIILTELTILDLNLCFQVLEYVMASSNPLKIRLLELFEIIINSSEKAEKKLYQIIREDKSKNKYLWTIMFLGVLPENRITKKYLPDIIHAYENLETERYLELNLLNKFKPYKSDIWVTVLTILLDKSNTSGFKLTTNFNSLFDANLSEFENDFEFLKRIYFYALSFGVHFDNDGKTFKYLLIRDEGFIIEYLSSFKNTFSKKYSHNKFEFIWSLANYKSIITKALDFFAAQRYFIPFEDISNRFFPQKEYEDKIETFLIDYIHQFCNEKGKMNLIFNIIFNVYPEKRIKYLGELIRFNSEEEFIKKLPLASLNKGDMVYNGTFASLYRRKKEFFEKLEKLFSKELKFLKLKKWASQEQKYYDNAIQRELKKAFTNEY